jgi:hypothetical protein
MAKIITPNKMMQSAGTWTETVTSNVWSDVRTAANATWVTMIPIYLPQSSSYHQGSYLVSIDIWYKVATEALDSLAATIYKATLPADGAAYGAPSSLDFTYNSGKDTAGERAEVDESKMTLTLDTPIWLDDDDQVYVELAGDGGANGVFEIFGARANFTLRE